MEIKFSNGKQLARFLNIEFLEPSKRIKAGEFVSPRLKIGLFHEYSNYPNVVEVMTDWVRRYPDNYTFLDFGLIRRDSGELVHRVSLPFSYAANIKLFRQDHLFLFEEWCAPKTGDYWLIARLQREDSTPKNFSYDYKDNQSPDDKFEQTGIVASVLEVYEKLVVIKPNSRGGKKGKTNERPKGPVFQIKKSDLAKINDMLLHRKPGK